MTDFNLIYSYQMCIAPAAASTVGVEGLWRSNSFQTSEQFFVVKNKKLALLEYVDKLGVDGINYICEQTLSVLEQSPKLENSHIIFSNPDKFTQYVSTNCGLIVYFLSVLRTGGGSAFYNKAVSCLINFLKKHIDFFPVSQLAIKSTFVECRNTELRDIAAEGELGDYITQDMIDQATYLIALMHYKQVFKKDNFPHVLDGLLSGLSNDKLEVIISLYALCLNEHNSHLFTNVAFVNLSYKLLNDMEEDRVRYGVIFLAASVRSDDGRKLLGEDVYVQLVNLLQRINEPQCKFSPQLILVVLINIIEIINSLNNIQLFLSKGLFGIMNKKLSEIDFAGIEKEKIQDTFLIQRLSDSFSDSSSGSASGSSFDSASGDSATGSSSSSAPPVEFYQSSFTHKSPPPSPSLSSSPFPTVLKLRNYLMSLYQILLVKTLEYPLAEGGKELIPDVFNSHLIQFVLSYKNGEEALLAQVIEYITNILYYLHINRYETNYSENFRTFKFLGDNCDELDAVKDEFTEDGLIFLIQLLDSDAFKKVKEDLLAAIFFLAFRYNLQDKFPLFVGTLLNEAKAALEVSVDGVHNDERIPRNFFAVWILCSFGDTGNAVMFINKPWFVKTLLGFLSKGSEDMWLRASSFLHLIAYSENADTILTTLYNEPNFLPLLANLVNINEMPIDLSKEEAVSVRGLVITDVVRVVELMCTTIPDIFDLHRLVSVGFFNSVATLMDFDIGHFATNTKFFPQPTVDDDGAGAGAGAVVASPPVPLDIQSLLVSYFSYSSSSQPPSVCTSIDLTKAMCIALFAIIERVANFTSLDVLRASIPKNIVGLILVGLQKFPSSFGKFVLRFSRQLLEIYENVSASASDENVKAEMTTILKQEHHASLLFLLFAQPQLYTGGFGASPMYVALSILILHNYVTPNSNITPVIVYVASNFLTDYEVEVADAADVDPEVLLMQKATAMNEQVKKKLTALARLAMHAESLPFLNNAVLAKRLLGLFAQWIPLLQRLDKEEMEQALRMLFALTTDLIEDESEAMVGMREKFVDADIFRVLGPFTNFAAFFVLFDYVQKILLKLIHPDNPPKFIQAFVNSEIYDLPTESSCLKNFVIFLTTYYHDFSTDEKSNNFPKEEVTRALNNNFTLLLRLVELNKDARERLANLDLIKMLLFVLYSGQNFTEIHMYWTLILLANFAREGAKDFDTNVYYDKFNEDALIPQSDNNNHLLQNVRYVYHCLFKLQQEINKDRMRNEVRKDYSNLNISMYNNTPVRFSEIISKLGTEARNMEEPRVGETFHIYMKEKNPTRLLAEMMELCLIIFCCVLKGKDFRPHYITFISHVHAPSLFEEHHGLFTNRGLLYSYAAKLESNIF